MVVIIRHKYATAHSKAAYLRQIGVFISIGFGIADSMGAFDGLYKKFD
jgi:hypothetical protein